MKWGSVAVIDEEADPPVVVTRYERPEQAEWYINYLYEHGGTARQAKILRGGYGIDVTGPKKSSSGRPERLAQHPRLDYTRSNKPPTATTPNKTEKAITMPPRGRKATAAAAPVVEEPEETDAGQFDHHLTKDLTDTMTLYGDWFHENVADINELGASDPGRLLALGSTLYPHFQKSDANQRMRAARKAERASSNGDAEEPEEAPAPARKGRAARTAVAAKPVAAAPAKPARRGRASASAEAPY